MGARSKCKEEVSGTLHRLVRFNFGDEIPVRGRECNTWYINICFVIFR